MPATTNVEANQSAGSKVDRAAAEARLLRELDGGRAALPILPHVAAQAIRFANDPNSDLRRLAELVEADPPIAARLLAVANSVVYTRTVRVSTTRAAIIRLGLEGTRDLLFQVVYASSTVGLPRYQDLVARSFRRSVLAGIAARLVSDKMRYRFEYDYLCGLLHNIGEARVYRILANFKESMDLDVVEELVERHHRRAGAELAISWGLPEPIIETCSHHHDDPEKASPLVKMVMMADLLVAITERRLAPRDAQAIVEPVPSVPVVSAPPAAKNEEPESLAQAVADAAQEAPPGPTDPGAPLGPTSAIWPTSFANPPGAPSEKPKEMDKNHDASSLSGLGAAIMTAVTTPPDGASKGRPPLTNPALVALENTDFEQLEKLGMSRDIAENVLIKLEESLGDLPL
jgi:HD-like signal output (HDOD) protein